MYPCGHVKWPNDATGLFPEECPTCAVPPPKFFQSEVTKPVPTYGVPERLYELTQLAEKFNASLVCLHDEVVVNNLPTERVEEFYKLWTEIEMKYLTESIASTLSQSFLGKEITPKTKEDLVDKTAQVFQHLLGKSTPSPMMTGSYVLGGLGKEISYIKELQKAQQNLNKVLFPRNSPKEYRFPDQGGLQGMVVTKDTKDPQYGVIVSNSGERWTSPSKWADSAKVTKRDQSEPHSWVVLSTDTPKPDAVEILRQYTALQRKEGDCKAFLEMYPEAPELWAEALRYTTYIAEVADEESKEEVSIPWDPEGVWDID